MPKLPKKPKEKEEAVKPFVESIAEAPSEPSWPEPATEAAPQVATEELPAAVKPKVWTVLERKQFSYKGQILHIVPGSLLNEHHYDKDFFETLKKIGVKLKEVL